MKKLINFMSITLILFMASCSSDIEDFVPGASGDVITIGIGMPGNDITRVSTTDLLNLTWESGDKIILLGYDENNNYVGRSESYEIKSGVGSKSGIFDVATVPNAKKYKVFYKSNNVTLNNDGSIKCNYLGQIQNKVNDSKHIKDCFALSSKEIYAENIKKGTTLSPLNAVMRLNIKDIYGISGKIDANTVGSIDLTIGDNNPAYLCFPSYKTLSIEKDKDNYFYMAFDPSVYLPISGLFKITIDGRVAEILSTEGKVYEPGKIYSVTLGTKENGKWGFIGDIGGTEVLPDPSTIDWRNKTVWVSGVNVPSLDQWGIFYGDNKGLEWTSKEQGWYDCTKIDPVDGGIDSRYCWAATCSNMIYWWLDQNKENVNKYGYNGPREYVSALDCEIFQYFKDHFTNCGCMIENGFNWFFKGKHINGDNITSATSNEAPVKGWSEHTGFFKDVLGGSNLYRICGGGSDFNENLKIAFMNNESIGLDISVKNGAGAHAVTIWGAKFDGNGNVCELYEVESNDVASLNIGHTIPGKETSVGLFAHKVKFVDGVYKLESSAAGHYTIGIRFAYFLGNHKAQWNAYWAKQGK